MSFGEIISVIGGSGGTVGVVIVMLALFITGHIVPRSRIDEMQQEKEGVREERDEWKGIAEIERRRADVERQRADAGVLAGQIARDIMLTLRKEIQ